MEHLNPRDVRNAEEERYRAQVAGDVEALYDLFSDDLVYQHSTGKCDDKTEFIKAIESGVVQYRAMNHEGLRVRVFGSVAVLTGKARFDVSVNGIDSVFNVRFHSIWTKQSGELKFVSWQATQTNE